MIAALLLAALSPVAIDVRPPQSAIDAERAFAADAETLGQWTAFRKYSSFAAVMFVPKVVHAWSWLRDRKDPPRSVRWQPAQSFETCDGRTAINIGPWQRPDGSFGYFTTVWLYEDQLIAGAKWVWVYDAGDTLKQPMMAPAEPTVRRASCTNIPSTLDDPMRYAIPSAPAPDAPDPAEAMLHSRDYSLRYDYAVDAKGNRQFKAWLWNGRAFEQILDQTAPATPK